MLRFKKHSILWKKDVCVCVFFTRIMQLVYIYRVYIQSSPWWLLLLPAWYTLLELCIDFCKLQCTDINVIYLYISVHFVFYYFIFNPILMNKWNFQINLVIAKLLTIFFRNRASLWTCLSFTHYLSLSVKGVPLFLT